MGAVGLGVLAFPIMALVLAIIFSPIGLSTNASCSLASGTNCALNFNNNATIVLSTSGYAVYDKAYLTCQQITGVSGFTGWLASLPILSSIFDFSAWLGASIGAIFTGNQQVASTCSSQVGNILIFNYTGTDLVFLLIGVVVTSAGIAAIAGISTIAGGENSAGTYIVFMVSALALFWIVLSSFALPTFSQMPVVIGGTLWTLLTAMYAFGMIEIMS